MSCTMELPSDNTYMNVYTQIPSNLSYLSIDTEERTNCNLGLSHLRENATLGKSQLMYTLPEPPISISKERSVLNHSVLAKNQRLKLLESRKLGTTSCLADLSYHSLSCDSES